VKQTTTSVYEFEWPVDQWGYEIRTEREEPFLPLAWPLPPELACDVDRIYPKGGSATLYRPMDDEHAGLWLRFADTCTSAEGVLLFASSFGQLYSRCDNPAGMYARRYDPLGPVLTLADVLRKIHMALCAGRRDIAEILYNHADWVGFLSPRIQSNPKTFKSELKFVPASLASALLIQTGEAIARNTRFRCCRNEGCKEWFRVGKGAATARKEFCSDRCRVASARHHKQESKANA
jgi:hypothetical protein